MSEYDEAFSSGYHAGYQEGWYDGYDDGIAEREGNDLEPIAGEFTIPFGAVSTVWGPLSWSSPHDARHGCWGTFDGYTHVCSGHYTAPKPNTCTTQDATRR